MSRQFRSDDTNTWLPKFGDGSNGALSFTGGTIGGSQGYYVTTITGTSGNKTATLGSSWSGKYICLIHQSRGTGNGNWELNVINNSSISTTATLLYPLQNQQDKAEHLSPQGAFTIRLDSFFFNLLSNFHLVIFVD